LSAEESRKNVDLSKLGDSSEYTEMHFSRITILRKQYKISCYSDERSEEESRRNGQTTTLGDPSKEIGISCSRMTIIC